MTAAYTATSTAAAIASASVRVTGAPLSPAPSGLGPEALARPVELPVLSERSSMPVRRVTSAVTGTKR